MGIYRPESMEGIAYDVFREWSEYWSADDVVGIWIPPLHHFGNTRRGGALIVAPCSFVEINPFIQSQRNHPAYVFTVEATELGTDWIGHWVLFSATPIRE